MPQVTLNCLKDTYISGSTSHGTENVLKMSSSIPMYLYFDLSQIPSVAKIDSALLLLTMTGYEGDYNYVDGFYTDLPKTTWDESINNSNEPPFEYDYSYTVKKISSSDVGGIVPFALISDVKDIVERKYANNGFRFRAQNPNNYYFMTAIFASRHSANPPVLVVGYSIASPSVPTYLTPGGGTVIDRGAIQRLSWQHNPTINGEVQSKFDIQWRKQGTTTWNTLTQTTQNQYYDYPAGTFEHGYIEWQVRTYDQLDQASPWSAISLFYAGDKPSIPVISSPTNNQVLSGPRPTVIWTATGHIEYNFKILENGNVVFEKDIKTSETSFTPEYSLENGKSYTLQLITKNADGLWSDVASVNVTTSFILPPLPVVTPSADIIRGSIILYIYNPPPGAGQSTPVANELYRRKQGETDWQRIKKDMANNSTYIDYTPACGVNYEYKVRAIDSNYSYIDSQIVTVQTNFQNSQLALVSDYSVFIELKYSPQKSQNNQLIGEQMHFAGRRHPVTQYSEHKEKSVSMSFKILDLDVLNNLEAICDSQQTILFRDSRGRRMFGTVFGLEVRDNLPDYYEVSFTINQVDFIEVV